MGVCYCEKGLLASTRWPLTSIQILHELLRSNESTHQIFTQVDSESWNVGLIPSNVNMPPLPIAFFSYNFYVACMCVLLFSCQFIPKC